MLDFKLLLSGSKQIIVRSITDARELFSLARRTKSRTEIQKIAETLTGKVCINLGCGNNPIKGWLNFDSCTIDGVLCWDLSRGIPLEDNSVDYVYSEHFIEHLTFQQAVVLLKEIYRVLKPGCVVRTAMPDLMEVVRNYMTNNFSKQDWMNWPKNSHVRSRAQVLNIAMRDWGHQWLYDADELKRLCMETKFIEYSRYNINESNHECLSNLETRKESCLTVEASKPGKL
ncbi:MAG: class I SAM-dependent methyltransferase [bacterium]